MLLITVAQVDSVWNVGIKTAAAQNMVAVGFIQELTGHDISWLDWFVAAAPFAALMSVVLYVVVTRLFKGSLENISGGDDAVRRELAKLGPMSAAEWKLTVVWQQEFAVFKCEATANCVTGHVCVNSNCLNRKRSKNFENC